MADILQTIDRFALGAGTTASHSRIYILLASLGAITLLILLFISVAARVDTRGQQSASIAHPSTSSLLLSKSMNKSPTLPTSNRTVTQVNQSTSSTGVRSTSAASVQVNGKNVSLPSTGNGTVHREITSSNGSKTSVDVTVDSHSSSNSSTLNLNVESSQSSTVNKSG